MYLYNAHLKNLLVIKTLSKRKGIGNRMAGQLCDELGVSTSIRFGQLSASRLNKLNQLLQQDYLIEDQLSAMINKNKKRLSSISSYRGLRYLAGLPCRGQRTHTNARTSRKQRLHSTEKQRMPRTKK